MRTDSAGRPLPDDTLKLILNYQERLPRTIADHTLDSLFQQLATCGVLEAERIEAAIWDLWMHRPGDEEASIALEAATEAIITEDFPEALSLLDPLIARCPDFSEAWHKRATVYYLTQRDEVCIADLRRTLALEPRHFGAMCHFAQICMSRGDDDTALYALNTALVLNPHLDEARATARRLMRENRRTMLQ